jgi:hypothetical protein
MSEHLAGGEVRDETGPILPPSTPNPLASLKLLVVPGLFAVALVLGVIFGVFPMWNAVSTVDNNLEKMRKDAVRAHSRTYQVAPTARPNYYPFNLTNR